MRKYFLIIYLLIASFSTAQNSELYNWLASKDGIEIKTLKTDSLFSERYEIRFTQPLDHNNPGGKTFTQKLYLSHRDQYSPMVLSTEGYTGWNRYLELTDILTANQIIVEHRYFGVSVPDSIDWKYLTTFQAASDHHAIVEFFKEYYEGKWVNTGISKGGQTVMYHNYYYPGDVDASVPYVAPLPFSRVDERIYSFLDTVGTDECNERILEFQKLCLKKKNELIPLFKESIEKSGNYTFSIGYEKAFEYIVLEYSFAYWQWINPECEKIPTEDDSINTIFNHLAYGSPFDYLSDEGVAGLAPFFYQAFTELGYYAYETEEFEGLLDYADGSNDVFWRFDDVELKFNPEVNEKMNRFIQNEANNMIFVYGGFDPWTAPGVQLTGKTNSVKLVLPGGNHRTRIRNLLPEQQEILYEKLEEWLEVTPYRL